MQHCAVMWSRASNKWAMQPSLQCWSPTGPSSNRSDFRMLLPGRNAMLPTQPVWAPSVCATGLSRRRVKPCGLDRSWPEYPSNRHAGPITTTGPIASFSRMELAANVLTAAPSAPLPKLATTRRNVGCTWPVPESTSKKPTNSKAMDVAYAKSGFPVRQEYRLGPLVKPWSKGSSRPHRHHWPDQDGAIGSLVTGVGVP